MNIDEVLAPDDDFGHLVHRQPLAVLQPANETEVVRWVEQARGEGVPLVARGAGHSVFGQSQARAGRLLDMRALREVRVEGSSAIVGAGATWAEVLRTTLVHGLAPKVLTDYVGLTVGGTLSVGGVGASSFRFGIQTECVEELTLVTGAGELHHCSRNENRELFDVARAGLGQVAIITRAKLELVTVPSHARHYRIPYLGIDELTSDLDRLVTEARFDQISAVGRVDGHGVWSFHIDAVCPFDPARPPDDARLLADLQTSAHVDVTDSTYQEYCTRLDPEIATWRASGIFQAIHPWIDVFVPAAALPRLAGSVLRSMAPADLGTTGGMILIYPITTAQHATPLLPLPRGRVYLFDVLRCVPDATPDRTDELLRANGRIYADALDLGGVLYPISAVAMTPADWQRHFGAHWPAFVTAKHRHDPDNLLGGGCGIFPARAR